MSETDRIKKIIPIMNEVSPTFCLAKWHHTSIYLHTGQTHSCYHPRPHIIRLLEIAQDPSALHNTHQKIEERRQMIQGDKPSGCQYCWNIEAHNQLSDRHYRSGEPWAAEDYEKLTIDKFTQKYGTTSLPAAICALHAELEAKP